MKKATRKNKKLAYEIGRRIYSIRRQQNITQVKLAKRLKVPKSTLAMWETGRNSVPIDYLIKISKILGVPFDYFIGLKKNPSYDLADNKRYFYKGYPIPMVYLKILDLLIKNKKH